MQPTKNIFFLLTIKRKDFRIKRVFAQKKQRGVAFFMWEKMFCKKGKLLYKNRVEKSLQCVLY